MGVEFGPSQKRDLLRLRELSASGTPSVHRSQVPAKERNQGCHHEVHSRAAKGTWQKGMQGLKPSTCDAHSVSMKLHLPRMERMFLICPLR